MRQEQQTPGKSLLGNSLTNPTSTEHPGGQAVHEVRTQVQSAAAVDSRGRVLREDKSIEVYINKWKQQISASAAEKDRLLCCYYTISKEANQLQDSVFSYAELLRTIATLFVAPSQDAADGVTRATRLMKMHRMSEALIQLSRSAQKLRHNKISRIALATVGRNRG